MRSKCISQHMVVGLEGGEFLLHPEADVIMEWFKENHPNYTLLSSKRLRVYTLHNSFTFALGNKFKRIG